MAFKALKLWFDESLINDLADKIGKQDKDFNSRQFKREISSKIEALEFKDRVRLIGDSIYSNTSGNYVDKTKILTAALGPKNPDSLGTFNNYFWVWPIASVAEHYGIDHYEESMHFIKEITQRATGEFAVRPFLEKYHQKTYAQMLKWSKDKSFHVKRLSSEGLRPLLPWAKKNIQFVDNPKPIWKLLEQLKSDEEKYVQKSVANHINDYLKLNPDAAKTLIEKWTASKNKNTQWIIFHAIRNERKRDSAWAKNILQRIGRDS